MTEKEKNVLLLEKLLILQKKIQDKKANEAKDRESAAAGGGEIKPIDVKLQPLTIIEEMKTLEVDKHNTDTIMDNLGIDQDKSVEIFFDPKIVEGTALMVSL